MSTPTRHTDPAAKPLNVDPQGRPISSDGKPHGGPEKLTTATSGGPGFVAAQDIAAAEPPIGDVAAITEAENAKEAYQKLDRMIQRLNSTAANLSKADQATLVRIAEQSKLALAKVR